MSVNVEYFCLCLYLMLNIATLNNCIIVVAASMNWCVDISTVDLEKHQLQI